MDVGLIPFKRNPVTYHADPIKAYEYLAAGVPVVACPAVGDMAENASRVAWAGVGVSLPRRLVTPRGVRLAVERVLSDSAYARRAAALGDWAARNDGAVRAAAAVEAFAARAGHA